MSDLANISALAARVVAAAVEWYEACGPYGPIDRDSWSIGALADAVEAFQAACGPVPDGRTLLIGIDVTIVEVTE